MLFFAVSRPAHPRPRTAPQHLRRCRTADPRVPLPLRPHPATKKYAVFAENACKPRERVLQLTPFFERANLAQLAELHLAKVEVEGSSPLVRSILSGV